MPDKIQKYVHSGDRTTSWFWHARAYFDAAKQLAIVYGEGGDASKHLIAPLIFNLRHAIELLLKFLAYGTGTTDSINHHDIHRIFLGVSEALAAIDKESLAFAADGLGIEEAFLAKYLAIMSEKVEGTTKKYYSYGFLTDDQTPIDDPNNVLFRYPSNTITKGFFDPEELKRRVPVTEILQDIELLSRFAWSIYIAFGKNQDGLHALKGLELKETREKAGSALQPEFHQVTNENAFAHGPNNLSIPAATVIPVLHYADVRLAAAWLCQAFGFTERLRIGDHRVQLNVGNGAVVVAQDTGVVETVSHSVMVRVTNVDQHFEKAKLAGANVTNQPTSFPYGERQYSVADLAGHLWTFSQSEADVEPSTWGGKLVGANDVA